MKTEARKSFRHGFVLTEPELRRIGDVATGQIEKASAGCQVSTSIEVRYKNGTITKDNSLEDLLSQENIGSKQIVRIAVAFQEVGAPQEHSIALIFANPDEYEDPYSVRYVVIGADRDWVFVTASQVEERIAKVKSFSFKIVLSKLGALRLLPLLFLVGMMGGFIILLGQHQPLVSTLLESRWREGSLKDPVEAIIIQQRGLEADKNALRPINMLAVSFFFPVLTTGLLLAAGTLLSYLFPTYVFCWGDYAKLFDKRIQIRRYVFGVLVAGLLVSVVAGAITNRLMVGR